MKKSPKNSYVFLHFDTPIDASMTYKIKNNKVYLEELIINSNGYLTL